MQKKTINKVLKSKINDWIDSIEDPELQKDLKKNVLVSGGCIASMFLNQPVADYDIYLQDMNTLVRLAEYYYPNQVLDGRKKEQYLKEYKQDNGYDENDDMGQEFVRVKNLKSDQVKMDVPKHGQKMNLDKSENAPKYQVAFISENAISLTNEIQIVTRFSGTPEEIHKNFDYVHATNYFTLESGIVTNISALESVLTKELRYQGSLYPLTSIIRMKKFIGRGWRINAGEMLKIMFQISELDLRNPEVMEEQLIGVDIAYFGVLIEILKGVKKESLTSQYLNEIIDRVFNNYDESDDSENEPAIDYQPEQ